MCSILPVLKRYFLCILKGITIVRSSWFSPLLSSFVFGHEALSAHVYEGCKVCIYISFSPCGHAAIPAPTGEYVIFAPLGCLWVCVLHSEPSAPCVCLSHQSQKQWLGLCSPLSYGFQRSFWFFIPSVPFYYLLNWSSDFQSPTKKNQNL